MLYTGLLRIRLLPVEAGIIKGVGQWRNRVASTLEDLSVCVKVKLKSPMKTGYRRLADMASWPMKTTGTFSNLRFENYGLPVGWDMGSIWYLMLKPAVRQFTYIEFTKPVTFYSLPDSIFDVCERFIWLKNFTDLLRTQK